MNERNDAWLVVVFFVPFVASLGLWVFLVLDSLAVAERSGHEFSREAKRHVSPQPGFTLRKVFSFR